MQRKSTNPFAHKAKAASDKKTGKRIGKSKQGKANNQLNRVLSRAKGSYVIKDGRFVAENK